MKSMFRRQIWTATSIAKARAIIHELDIRDPDELDLVLVASHYDVLVMHRALNGADGSLVRNGANAVITVNSSIKQEGKKRFVIAHELGHFFLHPETRQFDLCKETDIDIWNYKRNPEEAEANTFTAELLMPEDLFEPCIRGEEPSFQLISNLAKQFKTTITATAIRFVSLTEESCALIASENSMRKWFFASKEFEFWLKEDESIHKYTCAAEIHAGKTMASRDNQVLAGAWLQDYDESSKECITEDSILLGNYGLVLSLLWVEEEI